MILTMTPVTVLTMTLVMVLTMTPVTILTMTLPVTTLTKIAHIMQIVDMGVIQVEGTVGVMGEVE